MTLAVLGATGYAGMLLLRLLAQHPAVKRVYAAARSTAGSQLADSDPGLPQHFLASRGGTVADEVRSPEEALRDPGDLVFSALPHGASADLCLPILGHVPVVDLSADFRFHDLDLFSAVYGIPAPAPEHQASAVYGLCEWNREALRNAWVVANPGCYPTATLLPLLPIAVAGLVTGPVVVHAMSGISGAGRKEKRNLLFAERTENLNAYSVGTQHRHGAEIDEQLRLATGTHPGGGPVFFNPHLVPVKQGMAVTTVVPVADPGAAEDAIVTRYADEPFVELTGDTPPETRHVRGSNRIRIGVRRETGAVILMSVIDNLWKGASGQAVQNMNIRFGLDETAGLIGGGDL